MASTYKVSDAIDIVSSTQAGRGMENLHTAGDLALRYLWIEYPWRQSLADLPPFHLIPEQPEYGSPLSAVPSNFDHLYKCWLVFAPADGSGKRRFELKVQSNIQEDDWNGTNWFDENMAVSYLSEISKFRLSAVPPANAGPPDYWIEGRYKVRPTKITGSNSSSTLVPWDDTYFPLYVETLRWKLWQLTGDPRAGSIQVFGTGQRQFSGQAAVVHDLVQQALEHEEQGRGPKIITPSRSLSDW